MKDYIFIKVNKALVKLFLIDIVIIKSNADYVSIGTKTKYYTVHSTMNNIEELLGSGFCRIHNQYIIQLKEIIKIEDECVYLSDTYSYSISRSRKENLINQLTII